MELKELVMYAQAGEQKLISVLCPTGLTGDRQYHFSNIHSTFYFGRDRKYSQPRRSSWK